MTSYILHFCAILFLYFLFSLFLYCTCVPGRAYAESISSMVCRTSVKFWASEVFIEQVLAKIISELADFRLYRNVLTSLF